MHALCLNSYDPDPPDMVYTYVSNYHIQFSRVVYTAFKYLGMKSKPGATDSSTHPRHKSTLQVLLLS
jgi:hypothetical protein